MINKINSTNTIDKIDNNKKSINFDKFLDMLKNNQIDKTSISIDNSKLSFKDINNNSYSLNISQENKEILKSLIKNENPSIINTNDNLIIIKNKELPSAKNNISFVDDDNKKENKNNGWKFNFSFGFNRTKYFNTDVHLNSSRINATIKDFEFKERTSAEYYNPANWKKFSESFKWIDEPTNSFSLSAEKNNNIIYATASHPKFLKKDYQDKRVIGTVDGVQVDKVMPIKEEFDGYNAQKGEMNMTRFENTHMQMDWQVGYGRRINIVSSDKYGSLSYIPSVHVGMTTGQHYDSYLKENKYWDYESHTDKNKVQGANLSIGNRLQYDYKRFNAFVENKMNFSHLEHQFLDGKASYNMMYNSTTFGVGIKLFETKGKK